MKKNILIGLIVMAVILGVMGWLTRNKKVEKTTEMGPTPTAVEVKRVEMKEVERKQPGEIIFGEINQTPEETTKYTLEREVINKEIVEKFLLEMGFDNFKKEENGKLTFYKNEETMQDAYVDIETQKFSYTETVKDKGQIRAKNGLNEEELKEKANKIVGVLAQGKYKWQLETINYCKPVYPRWVTTKKENSDAVQFNGYWVINGAKVIDYIEEPIKITMAWSGKIVKAEIKLIPGTLKSTGKVKLPTVAEIKKTTPEKMMVWEVKGGENFEINEKTEELIKRVVINKVEPVLVVNKELGNVENYLMATGTNGEKKENIIKMLVAIEK